MTFHPFFLAAGVIWSAFFDGRISMAVRDSRLAALRADWGIR